MAQPAANVRTRRRTALMMASVLVSIFTRGALGLCPRGLRVVPVSSTPSRVFRGECSAFQAVRQKWTTTGPGTATVMAISLAPPRTKAEKKTEHFELSPSGMVEFGSSQRVEVR